MITIYDPILKAYVSLDEGERVRQIRYSHELWESEQDIPRLSAAEYLNAMAETLRIPKQTLQNLQTKTSFLEPREQGIEYHLDVEKVLLDSVLLGYHQTYMNVPVWRKGLSVTLMQNPNRVVGVTDNSADDIHGDLPAAETIARYKKIFQKVAAREIAIQNGLLEDKHDPKDDTVLFVHDLIKANSPRVSSQQKRPKVSQHRDETRLMGGKFFIYKYDPQLRYAGKPQSSYKKDNKRGAEITEEIQIPNLIPVAETLKVDQSYLVAEFIFTSDAVGFDGLVWLILVELETSSILYIECMTCGVDGLVFRVDPKVKTGNLTLNSQSSNVNLNPHREFAVLRNLAAPISGQQALKGFYVKIEPNYFDSVQDAAPNIIPSTQPIGASFDYDARTNDFGAVNAYYHQTELFNTIESLGFSVTTYFPTTTFPILVDHRSLGTEINAHWAPNRYGGTNHICFGLCDTTNIAEPLLLAVDPSVHWHEGAHGVLGAHIGVGRLQFAEGIGDGLAALQMDPESKLRELGLPERFVFAPFVPLRTQRRFDRDVAQWAWGGPDTQDDQYYGSEEILATCDFRIYRSIGGDHSDLTRRQFASRMVTYLILRTVSLLTPYNTPSNQVNAFRSVPGRGAQLWCEYMQTADLFNCSWGGYSGGAYNKVIRWAFEKQGSYQPIGAPDPVTHPVTTIGAPPAVDVYIDDGRAGEYQFQAVHWQNMSIWNRNSPDGLSGHQNPIEGRANFIYGKVKNRGTSIANNVKVKCFSSFAGVGHVWPNDFIEQLPAGGITIPTINPNNSQEVIVGPFTWYPSYNSSTIMLVASHASDTSNVDNIPWTKTIEEWRLVPNDNNIGLRNVTLVPGGGGPGVGGMIIFGETVNRVTFWAKNPSNLAANMELRVDMPNVLAERGWKIQFTDLEDNKFRLKSGEKRQIQLRSVEGSPFTTDDLRKAEDRNINIYLYCNRLLVGGMTYCVDPDLTQLSGIPDNKSQDAAQKLLDTLNISGKQKVADVLVKKISLDIVFDQNDSD